AREVVLKNDLQPEKSYNLHLSYHRYIHLPNGFMTLETSLFQTHFTNKIIADYQTHPNQIIYDNLNGYAVSRGISLNIDAQFFQPLTINVGTTLLDVFQKRESAKERLLLAERFSTTFSVSYEWQKIGFKVDYTGNIYGKMKLPLLSELDPRPAYSPIFSLQHLKISKEWNNGWTLYGGLRNLLNVTPPANAIARAFDPFDKQVVFDENGKVVPTANNPYALTFDTAYVYASFLKRHGFFGISWKIK
ncbi:MAG: TonB-dependent receptor, partial [Flammeovirgaceae bacterium]|nr:TonB-dependent receptor [Flammeovirgaceae bacterium]MDW8288680.1 TonB-dependent receptor [Flammeovirgaceae bacterium]